MILKDELCVEKFSGKSVNSVLQDFWASMFLLNSVALIQAEADAKIRKRHADKNNKLQYKARTSNLIVSLRDEFIFAALLPNRALAAAKMTVLLKKIARTVSPVRPNRSFPRHPAPCQAANFNLKSTL